MKRWAGGTTDGNIDLLSFSPQKPAENVQKRSPKENNIGLLLKSNTTDIKLIETREKKNTVAESKRSGRKCVLILKLINWENYRNVKKVILHTFLP